MSMDVEPASEAGRIDRAHSEAGWGYLGFGRPLMPLALGCLSLIVVAGAIVWLVIVSARQSSSVVRAFEVQADAGRLFRLVQSAETGQRGFLLTGDQAYLEPYRLARTAIPDALSSLSNAVADRSSQRDDTAALKELVREKLSELDKTVTLQTQNEAPAALAEVKSGRGLALMDDIRERVGRIQDREKAVLDEDYADSQRASRALLAISVAAIVLVIVFAGFAIAAARRHALLLERSRQDTLEAYDNLEEIVSQRTSELRESNEEIQRFAYIVSHDLRAPLVNVMGFTNELEVLKDDMMKAGTLADNDPERARVAGEFDESIGYIKAAITKMESLIAAILKLSRDGRRQFNPEPVAMNEMIRELADAQRHQTEEIEATVEIAGSLPAIIADKLAIQQIFGNLIDNAIKYLSPARSGKIQISGERVGSRVRYRVRDNGRGIAAKDHDRVFELFRRSGAQDKPGEGIGLAHVQTLVRSLNGRIDLQSEPDAGSTFIVTLPLRQAVGEDGGKGNG